MELKELCEQTLCIFEISDIKDLQSKLFECVKNNDVKKYSQFHSLVGDLSTDWLQKIFQYYYADRKEKMQDYTPKSLAELISKLVGDNDTIIDMCAGSGALAIQRWNLNHDSKFILYEFDETVLPFLLFNMALRNIDCIVLHSNVLWQETYHTYKIYQGEIYGTFREIENYTAELEGISLISNPPYNVKWDIPPFAQIQPRFCECEVPPEGNANFAFILTALSMIDDKAVFLLPCSVLNTTNKKESAIRKYLVDKNLVESVIMCPQNMFEATSIATCIIVFNKKKSTTKTEIVDARNICETEAREQRGQYGSKAHTNRVYKKNVNVFSDENMQKITYAIENQKTEKYFSVCVSVRDISTHNYRLDASCYFEIDVNNIQVHRDYSDIVNDINRIVAEKNACKLTINESLAKSLGFDVELYKAKQEISGLNELLQKLGASALVEQNYFMTSKKKNEIRFENNSKDILSSILVLILNNWKQHIFYLNQEENRYLAELRDALLPELMSGKIEV